LPYQKRIPKMADDRTKQGPQDRSRVNIQEPYEVEYWSKKFGVSPADLRSAVERVGPMANMVEEALKAKS
jgi:hypothetical protein